MRNEVSSGKNTGTLWTRDFTIITVGSVISMLGNSVSGFAMSLLVLDISQSTFLYAVYLAMYTLPQLVMPVIFGAVLDRFSRRKMIYTLDFLSSGLYLMMAIVLAGGWFSFPLFAVYCFVIGSIQSIYMVAYESFYPLLITEGFFQKAYSIASVLETFTAVMVPVSAFLYGKIGLAPLLAVNAVCFFLAAVMETQIRAKEQYIEKQQNRLEEKVPYRRQIFADIRDGFAYLVSEKGLLIVAVYFAISSVCGGTSWTLTLPYFRNTFEHGEYIYMLVWGTMLAARSLGGLFHYRWSIPAAWRYMIALAVYVVINVNEGIYLFFPIPVMMALCAVIGVGGVTTYTIRVSATQSYVPDENKGRFNGAFNVLNTAGQLLGELLAGVLALYMNERIILMIVMLSGAASALLLIGGGRRYVEPIYNRQE